MSYIQKNKSYRKIILNTDNATIKEVGKATAGTGNSEFTFKGFNTITVKENSYLKIDGVSADITSDAVWTFKLDNIFYNQNSYYNSDAEVTSPDATVSKIHINLKVDIDKDDAPDITLNADVDLRIRIGLKYCGG